MEKPRYSYSKRVCFVMLVENIVGNPNHHFSQKIGNFRRKGKKMLVKKRIKTASGEKKGLLLTRESSGEGAAGGDFRMLEVSGGYEGIKERFSTAVLKCIIIRLDCSSRTDKMPLLARRNLLV